MRIQGLVIAGGQGSRMGGVDKGLVALRGSTMAALVIQRLAPQVSNQIVLNVNRNADVYSAFGYPTVSDSILGFAGPLAGIAAGMDWCLKSGGLSTQDWILTVPCDSPDFPIDLSEQLSRAIQAQGAQIAVARTGSGPQPVFALYSLSLLPSLLAFLESGKRKIDVWTAQHSAAHVDFPDEKAFANINTVSDLQRI